ncbi:hypothetical protein SH528x_001870 [Novipirellula sp. SH528]|uniref:hypothetical protein n=1 Tax=Novipirellula sp. SH528 TaxID=3454466 RepID=UPI003FA17CBA
MKFVAVSLLIVASLGLVAHAAGLWGVIGRDTAGFAVSLRNNDFVSHDAAHAIGLSAHIVGIALSLSVLVGAFNLLRNRSYRLCSLLGLGISIPALSPLFGLAFPLGIAAIVIGVRNRRRSVEPNAGT